MQILKNFGFVPTLLIGKTMLLRKDIRSIKAYVPGKPLRTLKKRSTPANVAKLNSNENALGTSKKAIAAMEKAVGDVFRYPDGSSYTLKRALAQRLKVQPDSIVLGNGSDELIDIIIKTFMNPGEEILTAQTTFIEYEIVAKANGFKARTVALKNFCFDLTALRRNVNKKTKLIFIANPNNPTGTYITQAQMIRFINSLPAHTLTVIDEAYLEYVDAKDFPRLINFINKKNIILMRTFSKAYGLAGLRVGYALTRKEFAQAMEKIRQPFNVNSIGQTAAQSSTQRYGIYRAHAKNNP